ncbi:MAG: homoserine kinase [Devosia sp.]|nr:homoserine kinase [Devosia sp.]
MSTEQDIPAPTVAQLGPILRDLDVSAPITVTELQGGTSATFRINLSDGGALVLKTYDEIRGKAPTKEAFATRFLDGLDLPVTRYLLLDESRSRLPFRFAITNYLHGASIRAFKGQPDEAEIYRQMGALLRKLHAVPMPAFGYIGESGIIDPVASNLEYVRAEAEREFQHFRERGGDPALANRLERRARARYDLAAHSRGPVFAHNDFHPGNVLANRDAAGKPQLTALIDFGNARAADAVFDLAKALFNCEHESPGCTPAILDGYGPIDHPDPEAALWLYTVLHRISMWSWLRYVGAIPEGENHELITALRKMADQVSG